MLISRPYHSLQFDIAQGDADKICYLLFPLPPRPDELKWLERAQENTGFTIVLISGLDWVNDMTPWPATGLKKKEWFGGKSDMFLKTMKDDYMPFIEKLLGMNSPSRYLMGVSLSGLFVIWAAFMSDLFAGVASISGSLWYDDLVEWVERRRPSASIEKVYMSLGKQEKLTRNQRLSQVEDCTKKIAAHIQKSEVDLLFDMDGGNHFSPMTPRFMKALEFFNRVATNVIEVQTIEQ